MVPKRRRNVLVGHRRQALGPICHALAHPQACRILAGHALPEHGPRGIAMPPQSAGAAVIGVRKGKRASPSARQVSGRERPCTGEPGGARGYAVSTVGGAREHGRTSMRAQEQADDEGRFERCL